jgi:AmpD protein
MLNKSLSFVPDSLQSGLQIDEQGWCLQAAQLASPNFGARPVDAIISMLVIHNISLPLGLYEGDYIAQLFQNQLDHQAHPSFASLRDLRVSSHFLIRRDGSLQQFVSTLDRAWHAGVSSFAGRDGCNDYSIGIELEGCDESAFELMQYVKLVELIQVLLVRFPIEHIVGHQDISPGRKTDPGPCFDWGYLRNMLSEWVA